MTNASAGSATGPVEHDAGGVPSASTVRLQYDQWIVTNTDDLAITHHGEWLPEVLTAHRHAVRFRLHKPLTLQYLLGEQHTAEDIARIRTIGEHVARLRREAAHAEVRIRAERIALMRELAQLHVAPREIAHILNVPTTAIPKDVGSDRDVRLSRYLLVHASTADDPVDPDRLF